jgi:GT2 family glycosyltransferase/tetratricopeptide (TPR) repeat protein
VTASGRPDDFRACLEDLRPTLGVHDEVVCVVPADRPDLRRALRGKTWLTVLEDVCGDQARRWEAGLAATNHPVVVLLDGEVFVSARWLEPLTEALDDPEVVAVGPRCHRTYGPQAAHLPEEALHRASSFKVHARAWRQEHHGRFTTVDGLGPVCVAVRRDALARAGGPTVDLPYEQLRSQGRIVVAHGALVAHVGSDLCALQLPDVSSESPLLSASLIVKDEEEVLASCLEALRDFVDEIVVYDTGSTDRTREIAREHGARVIEGYWNDHFGDARNRALAHCTGQWVLYVDADEIVTGDPAHVRRQVYAATRPSFLVGVENSAAHGNTMRERQLYPRLFRRNRARYIRRLHEQVVDRVLGEVLVSSQTLDGMTLIHSGYTHARMTAKDKGARNLRLAELSAADEDDVTANLLSLARSQWLAGRLAEAIDNCHKGLASDPDPISRKVLLTTLASCHNQMGCFDAAHAAIRDLRQVSTSSVMADELEAQVRYAEGDLAGALALIQDFPETATTDIFTVVNRDRLAEIEILSLFHLGRYHEAAQRLRDCVQKETLPLTVVRMAQVLKADGSSIAELATLLAQAALRGLLLSASEAPDELVDELLAALWQQYPGSPAVLASAAQVGGRLPLMRAMEWSARLRQHGFAEECTLLTLAGDPGRTPRERVLASAIAFEMFSDERAMPLLADALGALPDDETDRALAELGMLTPTIAAAIEPTGVG